MYSVQVYLAIVNTITGPFCHLNTAMMHYGVTAIYTFGVEKSQLANKTCGPANDILLYFVSSFYYRGISLSGRLFTYFLKTNEQ